MIEKCRREVKRKYTRNEYDLLVLTTSPPLTSDFQEHVENAFVKHNIFLDAHCSQTSEKYTAPLLSVILGLQGRSEFMIFRLV